MSWMSEWTELILEAYIKKNAVSSWLGIFICLGFIGLSVWFVVGAAS